MSGKIHGLNETKIFLRFIKIHILYHAGKEPVHGLWLIEELKIK